MVLHRFTSVLPLFLRLPSIQRTSPTVTTDAREAVPQAVPEAERLIEEADLNSLYYDLCLGIQGLSQII